SAQLDQQTPKLDAMNLIGTYQHVDRATGHVLTCDKCPAGTFVSEHCTNSSLRVCSSCPPGTFTRHENGIEKCHDCTKPCEVPMVEKTPCSALNDRVCACPPGMFLANDTCVPHSVCPTGWGVRKKGTETEDVRCRPCGRGTFSDVPSSVMRCRAHTDCRGRNLTVVAAGTKEKDSICGPPLVLPGAASSPDPKLVEDQNGPSPTSIPQGNKLTGARDPVTGQGIGWRSLRAGNLSVLLYCTFPSVYGHQQNHHHSHIQTGPRPLPPPGGHGRREVQRASQSPQERSPRQNRAHRHFDINEHLPWMIVLFLLLVLFRTLKKGPRQDPSAIVEKAGLKKPPPHLRTREKWIYYCNGHGIDILKLVAAQVGSQWKDIYQFLCNASEREVAAFSNGYTADHERAYAALRHWTIRGPEASLAQLISALRQHRRNDVVEKIRGLMEDTAQLEGDKLALPTSPAPLSPSPVLSPGPKADNVAALAVDPSPLDKNKGFFVDESEPLLRCDSTSSGSSALSRNGSFITKEKKDTVLRQVRLDPCDLQPIFDDMLHILNPDELHVIEEIPQAEDKLDRLFEIIGVKSQEASQALLDSVYSHLPDLL
uniref:Tumor necrosis factor receptor superfamily member 21 n=1 Tax=Ornithorhynchus anatinus TaxID=9258 RepID=A0A6I8N0E0_ORNAN